MNLNHFLQTARTVTFIIQKHKGSIPDYETWYAGAVTTPWKSDEVMKWAVQARNEIEKEGDLETNSTLNLTLLFSYLAEQDLVIEIGKAELRNAGVKTLVRLARKKLPAGVADAAVVKIERCWVTATLPNWELLHALVYVYARIFESCGSLARQFGETLDSTIPTAANLEVWRESARRVRYLKLNGLESHSIASNSIPLDGDATPPEEIREGFNKLHTTAGPPTSFEEVMTYYTTMAELTFGHWGNHDSMLFLLDERWRPIDMIGTRFEDQADKFIFWRYIADRITILKRFGLVWISESWIRNVDKTGQAAIRDMPIVGERLGVVAIDKAGNQSHVSWEILRPPEPSKPTLRRVSKPDFQLDAGGQYFLVPAIRAMGLPDPTWVADPSGKHTS
jgi:hypothetical protein